MPGSRGSALHPKPRAQDRTRSRVVAVRQAGRATREAMTRGRRANCRPRARLRALRHQELAKSVRAGPSRAGSLVDRYGEAATVRAAAEEFQWSSVADEGRRIADRVIAKSSEYVFKDPTDCNCSGAAPDQRAR